ncbi:MAG TPA: hypothetical protein DGT21_24430 [Armatimonadetes bacterium]|nr:hypothetical protein [Armatimonadota bacterium]
MCELARPMRVVYRTRTLEKACNLQKDGDRLWGRQIAGKVRLRIEQIRGVDVLAELRLIPGARFHQLTGDRLGQCAMDLTKNWRIIVEPWDELRSEIIGGDVNEEDVRAVRIRDVEDYH